MGQLSTGAHAPDFELWTPDDQPRTLRKALATGPVVLAFYKESCPTSQLTFTFIQKIFEAAGKQSAATVWGISQDDAEETRKFTGSFGLGFDVLIDGHPYPVSTEYGVEFVPAVFVAGKDGIISLSDFGFSKPTLREIARIVASHAGCEPPELFYPNDGLPAIRPG